VLVIDASVLAVALLDDGPDGDLVRHRLRGERLAAPASIDRQALPWSAIGHRSQPLEAATIDF